MPTPGGKSAAEPGAGTGEKRGQARGRLGASRVRGELQGPSCWAHCSMWETWTEMVLRMVGRLAGVRQLVYSQDYKVPWGLSPPSSAAPAGRRAGAGATEQTAFGG